MGQFFGAIAHLFMIQVMLFLGFVARKSICAV